MPSLMNIYPHAENYFRFQQYYRTDPFLTLSYYIYICTQIDVNVDDDLDDDVDDDDDDVDDVDDDDDDDDGYGILRIAYGIWHMAST